MKEINSISECVDTLDKVAQLLYSLSISGNPLPSDILVELIELQSYRIKSCSCFLCVQSHNFPK